MLNNFNPGIYMRILDILISAASLIPWEKIVKFILREYGDMEKVKNELAKNPPENLPRQDWMRIATQEIGQKEIPGYRHNPRIIHYGKSVSLKISNDETPWCASFVAFCLETAQVKSTRSAMARSYEKWGTAIEPHYGAIVVMWRKSLESGSGHVGFYVGEDPKNTNNIMMLSGNSNNQVRISSYSKSRILGYRWPE